MKFAALTLLLLPWMAGLAGCAAQDRMGVPITERNSTEARVVDHAQDAGVPATAFQSWMPQRQGQPKDWSASDWVEPFYICTINYRLRRYDALLHCLDDVDQGVAALGSSMLYAAPADFRHSSILTAWLRASAYAELGDTETALHWAETAWHALPPDYQRAELSYLAFRETRSIGFNSLCNYLSGGWRRSSHDPMRGRNNPAALDLRAETVAMSLEAELSLLYRQLGQTQRADEALDRLRKWKDAPTLWNLLDDSTRVTARLLAIGPLLAAHQDQEVVSAYESVASELQDWTRRNQLADSVLNVGTLGMWPLAAAAIGADERAFSVSLEQASNALLYATALARLGQAARAASVLDNVLQQPGIGDMGSVYWSALYLRGSLAFQAGQRDAAIDDLRHSVDAIERTRASISYEAAKIGFAGDKQQVYATLVEVLAEGQDWSAVFEVVERAKARALVDLLAQQRTVRPSADADTRVRELLSQADVEGTSLPFGASEQASRARGRAREASAALAVHAPELASLLAVPSVPAKDIAVQLAPDETLVDFYLTGRWLYALVLTAGRIDGHRLPAEGLDAQVRAYRHAIATADPASDLLAQGLYDRLLRPLGEARGQRRLTLCPHGILHYLPFAALHDGQAYLVDRYPLRILPSATTLLYLRNGTSGRPGKLLAFGNPDLGNPDYDLPNAQSEALNVAAMFPASKALVRKDASKTALKNLGGGFAMLHFATHGEFDTDAPLTSGLLLAKGSEPDGRLTVADLYGLSLDADLVTLSACETGLGKVANGDDVIGLTRGFLHAGARSIVASLWEVDDVSTQTLMLRFYQELQAHDKEEALQRAEIAIRKLYPQTRDWAAFQLIGRTD